MSGLFVDTSGWLAILATRDANHEAAVEKYSAFVATGGTIFLHDGILLEVGNALSGRSHRDLAVRLFKDLKRSRLVKIEALTPELLSAAWEFYAERDDKDWGIVDCVSFLVMRDHGVVGALTADRHFVQAGFRKLL